MARHAGQVGRLERAHVGEQRRGDEDHREQGQRPTEGAEENSERAAEHVVGDHAKAVPDVRDQAPRHRLRRVGQQVAGMQRPERPHQVLLQVLHQIGQGGDERAGLGHDHRQEDVGQQEEHGEQDQEREQDGQAARNDLREQVDREGQHQGHCEPREGHRRHDRHRPQDQRQHGGQAKQDEPPCRGGDPYRGRLAGIRSSHDTALGQPDGFRRQVSQFHLSLASRFAPQPASPQTSVSLRQRMIPVRPCWSTNQPFILAANPGDQGIPSREVRVPFLVNGIRTAS